VDKIRHNLAIVLFESRTEKELYVKDLIMALKLQVHCMAQAAKIMDPTIDLLKIEVCGSLGDYLRGQKERFRTPLEFPQGNYSDIDAVLTFNKPDDIVRDILLKAEARHCPCIYMPRIGVHEFVWNLPSRAPCPPSERVII